MVLLFVLPSSAALSWMAISSILYSSNLSVVGALSCNRFLRLVPPSAAAKLTTRRQKVGSGKGGGSSSKIRRNMAEKGASPPSTPPPMSSRAAFWFSRMEDLVPYKTTTISGKPRTKQDTRQGNVVDLTLNSSDEENDSKPSSKSKKRSLNTPPVVLPLATYNIWFGPPHPAARMTHLASLLTSPQTSPVLIGMQEVTPVLSQTLFPLLSEYGYEVYSQNLEEVQYGCAIAVRTKTLQEKQGNQKTDGMTAKVLYSGFLRYDRTIMGRGLAWVICRLHHLSSSSFSTEVMFTTTHLESYVPNYPAPGQTYTGAAQRQSQIQEATQFCQEYMERRKSIQAAYVTGDLNWDDERPTARSKGVDPPLLQVVNRKEKGGGFEWKDVWLDLQTQAQAGRNNKENTSAKKAKPKLSKEEKDQAAGYTYDAKKNPMLGGHLRRRFDRCLVTTSPSQRQDGEKNNKGQSIPMMPSVQKVELLGQEAIPGLIWHKEMKSFWGNKQGSAKPTVKSLPVLPSDHYGFMAWMELTATSERGESSAQSQQMNSKSSPSPARKKKKGSSLTKK